MSWQYETLNTKARESLKITYIALPVFQKATVYVSVYSIFFI